MPLMYYEVLALLSRIYYITKIVIDNTEDSALNKYVDHPDEEGKAMAWDGSGHQLLHSYNAY